MEEVRTYHYAELDKDDICRGVSDLAGEVDKSNMIRIDACDISLIGKKYIDGEFIEVEGNDEIITEQHQQEPTNAEIAQMSMAIIEGMIDISERFDRWEATL